jgi:hypothetical protein
MGTAATLAVFPVNNEPLSVAEEYALLTGEEIFAASRETSNQYNGVVLAKAVVIVQTRLRCSSLVELGRRMGVSRGTICRYAGARRMISNQLFHHAIRDLAILLDEEGGRR